LKCFCFSLSSTFELPLLGERIEIGSERSGLLASMVSDYGSILAS